MSVGTTVGVAELGDRLRAVPRVPLAHLPTPLQELPRLSADLGVRVLMKRDDLTGLAFGGSKSRILEFRLAEMLAFGATDVVAVLDIQSNSAVQTTAALNRHGLTPHLVLFGDDPCMQGNLLLDSLLGATIELVASQEDARTRAGETTEHLRRRGRTPFHLNEGRMFELGSSLAYAACVLELIEQLDAIGAPADAVYLSSAGKSQAGIVLADRLLGLGWDVAGFAARPAPEAAHVVAGIAARSADLLGLQLSIDPRDVVNDDSFAGGAYKRPTRVALAALKRVARLEGILLDTTYTAKAMAGLLDHVESGRIEQGQTVVFVHTGGTAVLFAEAEHILGGRA